HPAIVIGSSCRRPRLNPALQTPGPGLYYRTVNPREQQLDSQPHQQQQAAKSSLIQPGMPGPPTASASRPAGQFLLIKQPNHDSHQLLNQIKYPHEPSAIIKCNRVLRPSSTSGHCYQHHRAPGGVITYNCEICNRKLAFYNKCALFAHVRTHKLGSPTAAKLKTLSEVSLKQECPSWRQAHAKYQEALKLSTPACRRAVSSNSSSCCSRSASSAGQLEPDRRRSVHCALPLPPGFPGRSQAAPWCSITIDLEEGSGTGGGSDSAANSVAGDVAADCPTDMSAASTASGAAGQEAKDSRPTAFNRSFAKGASTPSPRPNRGLLGFNDSSPAPAANLRVCGGSFDSLAVHLGDSLKECPLCKKFVPDSRCALRAHFRLALVRPGPVSGVRRGGGPATATQLEREVAMRVHLRSQCLHLQRSKVFICLKCEYPPRAFSALRQLADHIIHSHTEKFFKCTSAMAFRCLDSCRQIFLEKKGLKRHLKHLPQHGVTDPTCPAQLVNPQSGPSVLYRCRDCPTQLPCTELTEHIFAQHPGLCYLCNSAQRSSAHLLACLLAGARMEGSQLDDDAGASFEGSVGGAKPAARSGFKRPAEREQQQQREQQKPEPAKIARVSSSAAAEESASPPASARPPPRHPAAWPAASAACAS
uniref:C2H2-type domain-containing protein n=1 Tax=Macrostomum lignano TaxID=282301 RepID=A0A1I8FKF8_9PLAT